MHKKRTRQSGHVQPLLHFAVGIYVSKDGSDGYSSPLPADPNVIVALLQHGARFRPLRSIGKWDSLKGWSVEKDGSLHILIRVKNAGILTPLGQDRQNDHSLLEAMRHSDLAQLNRIM